LCWRGCFVLVWLLPRRQKTRCLRRKNVLSRRQKMQGVDPLLRKERVLEALRLLSVQRKAQDGVLRRHLGFSAEEVAGWAEVDRTNASRDLNLLAQEGKIERIPGRPVLFSIKEFSGINRGPPTPYPPDRVATSAINGTSMISPGATGQQGEQGGYRSEVQGDSRSMGRLPHYHTTTRDSRSSKQAGANPTPTTGQDQGAGVVSRLETDKPPAVSASVQVGAIVTSFDTLIGGSTGLKVAVQQAKAAMLYPPHGLHTLLVGPSGVGKTTFARIMHVFALEHHALPPDAPFISFNCADYAGNPQLLMAHLFGVVRGAYTGADRDRVGLVEQAHRGILFLDEVHRLAPEGQEMLFYLMDRERFRRLGDVAERHASLLMLAATTEDPSTALLPTFRRRIPMIINLPGLHERSITERYELLRAFFTTECSAVGAHISVTPQALQALLLYECPGNIGQLRTDVQLACARAYLEYRTKGISEGTSELSIDLHILPDHVRRGLLRTAELHRNLESTDSIQRISTEATHIFTPTGLSLDSVPESAQDLYATISNDLNRLRRNGVAEHEISRLLHLDIQSYFQRFADQVAEARPGTASHLVDEHIAEVSRGIVLYAEEELGRVFPPKLALVLAMHLTSMLERTPHDKSGGYGQQIDSTPTMNRDTCPPDRVATVAPRFIVGVRRTYPIEYEVARMALLQFRSALGVTLPESEIDVLAVLLANADALLSNEQATVGIVVAAHGRGIAGGLAELANTLVGVNSVRWVELTLEQSPEELVAQVADWVRVANQGSGVLLFVDFASLLSLDELVTQQTGVQVCTVAGVSAPLVVEAVRRSQRTKHLTLDQLAASLTLTAEGTRKGYRYSENSAWEGGNGLSTAVERPGASSAPTVGQDDNRAWTSDSPQGAVRHRVILSVCLTGFGSATKIAELIEQRLPGLSQQGVEIVCMDISLSRGLIDTLDLAPSELAASVPEADVQRIIGKRPSVDAAQRDVVAIVGTINPHLESYPFIALTDFLFGDGVARLRTLLGKTLIDPALLQPNVIQVPTSTVHAPIFTQRSDLMREITNTLSEHLLFLNPARAMPLIESMIGLIEVEVGETFDIEVLAGLVLHLACIMERGVQHPDLLVNELVRRQVEQQFPRELGICRRALQVLSAQIAHPLPDEEAYNIVGILRQVDIFMGETA
jgi:transcriptional regulator with AAA-type ATPase domain/transcriptional regulatory protein LevR